MSNMDTTGYSEGFLSSEGGALVSVGVANQPDPVDYDALEVKYGRTKDQEPSVKELIDISEESCRGRQVLLGDEFETLEDNAELRKARNLLGRCDFAWGVWGEDTWRIYGLPVLRAVEKEYGLAPIKSRKIPLSKKLWMSRDFLANKITELQHQ